jgi:hypothetical protein
VGLDWFARRIRSDHFVAPANFGVKLMRPGFGPPAEPAAYFASVTASRRLQFASRGFATPRRQPPRRFGFGTRDRPHSLHQGR